MADKLSVPPSKTPATSLNFVQPETLLEKISQMHELIAQRAFEIFAGEGANFGHEVEHWLKAEEELLHPAHVNITESADTLNVEAEVPGFNIDELQVGLEPRRLTITGSKDSRRERKDGQIVYQERCSNELLRVIDLPAEVTVSGATVTLKDGILELTIPKAQTKSVQTAAKAAGAS